MAACPRAICIYFFSRSYKFSTLFLFVFCFCRTKKKTKTWKKFSVWRNDFDEGFFEAKVAETITPDFSQVCGQYYKHFTLVNYNSRENCRFQPLKESLFMSVKCCIGLTTGLLTPSCKTKSQVCFWSHGPSLSQGLYKIKDTV